MLETSEERVRLLKAGIFGKTIERLYLIGNNFKVVNYSTARSSIKKKKGY
ncbi:MAG: hypothetical protein J5U19_02845 [Candidatus Methanoperedens sp.]|nr:hypothetical protein [Candidatus Methanoperedens sp.]MCE8427317.1 hypothetical protein [Candidatus Methanoperedens sp.]